MTAQQLVKIGQDLYGMKGWQSEMAASLSVDVTTVRRWMHSGHVPGPAAVALEGIIEIRRLKAKLKEMRG